MKAAREKKKASASSTAGAGKPSSAQKKGGGGSGLFIGLGVAVLAIGAGVMHSGLLRAAPPQAPEAGKRPALAPAQKLDPSHLAETHKTLPNQDLLNVWVTPVLSKAECEWLMHVADEKNDWKPRLNYDTREVQLTQLAKISEWVATKGGVQDRVFELLRKQFHLEDDRPLERFSSNIIRYEGAHNEVMMHSDISHFTFNVLLSDHRSFSGGGTGMSHLNTTLHPEQGQMISYYGNAFHSGEPVTKGVRYIWQGFVNANINRDAGESLTQEQDNDPDRMGDEMKLHGDEKTHIAFGQQALANRPEMYDGWFSVGNLLRNAGRHDESTLYLKNALDSGYKAKDVVYSKLAETYVQQQRLTEAHAELAKAVEFNPKNDIVVNMFKDLGRHLKKAGKI